MKVSVIIPSLYEVDGKYLELAVKSLRETTNWQIVVVTNGTKHTPNLKHIKGMSIHLHTPAQGQNGAVNIGAQVVEPTTDYLMVSNADMYYAPGWNKNLRFDDLVFSPNLIEPTDNAGSAPPFLKYPGGLTLEEFNQAMINDTVAHLVHNDSEETKPKTEDGFNLPFFIRRDVWQTIEGYDIKYDPWGSNGDTDLQTKIELAGIKPRRYRDVLVYHFSNKSGTFDFSHAGRQEAWQKNFDYYRQKWGYTRDDEPKADVWYSKNMVLQDKLIYHPPWEGKYAS